jgi:hypothetical protein
VNNLPISAPATLIALALPILPLLTLAAVVAVVAVASLLPGERLRSHVRQLIPLLTTAIRAVRARPPGAAGSGVIGRRRRGDPVGNPP